MHFKRLLAGLGALIFVSVAGMAQAQGVSQKTATCDVKYPNNCLKPASDGSIAVTGTISASAPFKVLGNATLAMTTASGRVALPTSDTTVFIYNGSTTSNAFVKLGNGSVVAAATDQVVAPGSYIAISNAAGNADVAGILASGTGTLYLSTGTGSPFAAGGGGAGGSGGVVTQPTAANLNATVVFPSAQPVSSTTLSTAAKQPALGTAGTPSADVITVQGVTSMTALKVDGSAVTQPVSSTTLSTAANQATEITSLGTIATNSGTQATAANQTTVQGAKAPGTAAATSELTGAVYTSAGITLTNGQQAALQFDSTGHLLTTASVGGLSQGSTTSGQTGVLNMAAVTTAAPSYTTAQTSPLSVDVHGGLRFLPMTAAGVAVDLSAPGGVLGVDGSTIATAINPFPVSTGATASVAISTTAAGGPTQLIAAVSTKKIYVYHYSLIVSGAGTFAWITGTGTNCGTGTAYMTGSSGHPMSFAANGGISAGGGGGPILITGASGELCYITTGAVDISGSVAYAQY